MKKLLTLSSALLLSSCAYGIDTQIQDVTFTTSGAHGARCSVYANDFHYRVQPPQTISLHKSHKPLRVKCLAPGNRRVEREIEPTLAGTSAWNVVNGVVPGVLVDATSGALYEYPSTIDIDFTNIPVKPALLPAHNNPDIKQPEEYRLEEIGASTPRLYSDRDDTPLMKRGGMQGDEGVFAEPTQEQVSGGKSVMDLAPMPDPVPTPVAGQ